MSNVNLLIGGRSYAVACADGEERHVAMLGRIIDDKLASMGSAGGQNEVRSLLFSALLLADELHEARRNVAGASSNVAPDAAETGDSAFAQLGPALERIADRIENLAAQLDSA